MGRCKSLGSLKSFLLCASEIWLFTSSVPCPLWGGAADQWMTESKHCSSWAQKFTPGGLVSLMAVTSLFIDMEGNTPFHKPMLFIHSFIHSFSQSFTLYILSLFWKLTEAETKSKIRRRKGLFLAASKENSRELSQSSVSLNSKIGVHGVHFKLRVHAYT